LNQPDDYSEVSPPLLANNEYSPYFQGNGTKFFHVGSNNLALGGDIFLPVWQSPHELVFADIQFYERSSNIFEGNAHLGYRHLLEDKQRLHGIYVAYDRRGTERGNYFSQITLGGECWFDKLFIGANYYHPIGETAKLISSDNIAEYRDNGPYKNLWFTKNQLYERSLGGGRP
jgi:hypothetical protein